MMKRENQHCEECVRFEKCITARGKNPYVWNFVFRDWHCFEPAGCLMIKKDDEVPEPEKAE